MSKHLLSLLITLSCVLANPSYAHASFVKSPATLVSKSWKTLKVADYITLSSDELSGLTGRRMNMWDKLSFEVTKMNMKKELKSNPTLLVSQYFIQTKKKRLAWGWWVAISVVTLGVIFVIAAAAALSSWN